MSKTILIDTSISEETRVAVTENGKLDDFEIESNKKNAVKGDVYLARITRVEPSLQAAFIDFGRQRHGFLSFNDIQSDYYQIPQTDLEKIKLEEEKAREELLKESQKEEEKNIIENNESLNDPVEKNTEQNHSNDKILIEKKYPIKRYKIQEVMGIIVRTAGSNKTKNEIERDLQNLIKIWESIKENALNSIAPALIHKESEIIKRTLRDMYDEDTQNIIVEGNDGYQKTKNFMKMIMPSHLKKVKKYRDKIPLFIKEKIENKLSEIFDTQVKLNSGDIW